MRAEVVSLDLYSPVPDAGGGSVARLAESLLVYGLELGSLTHVRPSERPVEEALGQALTRSHLVVVTGGVVRGSASTTSGGAEDIVKKTLSRLLDKRLILQQELLTRTEEYCQSRRIELPAGYEKSALLPQGSVPLVGPGGEPAGFYIEHKGRFVVFMPALPEELGPAIPEAVTGRLAGRARARYFERSVVIRSYGLDEPKVAELLKDACGRDASLTFFTTGEGVDIRVAAKSEMQDRAVSALEEAAGRVAGLLDDYCYATGSSGMEETVARLLIDKKLTVATAESCTGGLIAKRLTDVPGSTSYMERGAVTYSNQSKVDMLGVSEKTLIDFGAVSRECAQEMAQGMRWNAGTDLAISVTGIAGPTGGTPTKPVGLVYIGFATGDGVTVRGFNFTGSREEVRFAASQRALDILRRYLLG